MAANRGPEVLCDHPGQLLVSSADAIDRPAAHPNLPLAPLPARAVDLSKQAPRDGGLEAGGVSRLVLLQIGIRRKGVSYSCRSLCSGPARVRMDEKRPNLRLPDTTGGRRQRQQSSRAREAKEEATVSGYPALRCAALHGMQVIAILFGQSRKYQYRAIPPYWTRQGNDRPANWVRRHTERAGRSYSSAKRICSFQLWPYLVVMHAGSTAQPSNCRTPQPSEGA